MVAALLRCLVYGLLGYLLGTLLGLAFVAYLQGAELPAKLPAIKGPIAPYVPLAVGKLSAGSGHGSATVIGPKRKKDNRWAVLTAAHCVPANGRATLRLQDGQRIGLYAEVVDRQHDLAWMATDRDDLELSSVELSASPPKVGEAVWVCGYGDKIEGLKRAGHVGDKKFHHRDHLIIMVTLGDSGTAVFDTDNKVISAICSTANPGQHIDTLIVPWTVVRKLRPKDE